MVDNRQSTINRAEQERMMHIIYREAAQMMKNGQSSYTIEQTLVGRGLRPEDARTVVRQLEQIKRKAYSEAGAKQMAIGAVICIIGLVVTIGSFSAAQGGGTYIVAWGAIVFGGYRFFKGMSMMDSH